VEVFSDIANKADVASKGYRLSIESILQIGFNLFRKAPAEFILFSLFGLVVFSNPLSGVLLGGPVIASYFHMARLAAGNRPIEFSDFFKGFEKTGSLLKLNLIISLAVLLGLMLLVVPGIYLAISYLFSHLFVWFHDETPAEALRLSRKSVSGNFAQIFLLVLVLAGINLLGVMALGVGILLTMPFSFCAVYAAFDDIIGVLN
jgi:hypothetical protein